MYTEEKGRGKVGLATNMHVPGRQFVEGSNNEKSVRTRMQSPKAPATDIESLGPKNFLLTDQ